MLSRVQNRINHNKASFSGVRPREIAELNRRKAALEQTLAQTDEFVFIAGKKVENPEYGKLKAVIQLIRHHIFSLNFRKKQNTGKLSDWTRHAGI